MAAEEFQWYKIVKEECIMQGDILKDCPIVIPPSKIEKGVAIDAKAVTYDVIVLSQSCDLIARKIKLVLVCPFWTLEAFGKKDNSFKDNEKKENLRQGNMPGFHLLNKCQLKDFESDFIIVNFKSVFAVPLDYLIEITKTKGQRLRLLPPYREHLSQAFARFFMRVGLPTDIPPFVK
jgi:hypothetical protein